MNLAGLALVLGVLEIVRYKLLHDLKKEILERIVRLETKAKIKVDY